MRITEIRDLTVNLRGGVENAVVSFAGHAVSLVAVVSDVVRNGRPLVGVAFNSIGRHAQPGILRDRMIPRVLASDPDSLIDPGTGLLSPQRVLEAAIRNEKPGGHGDRATAAAAIELACWDLIGKFHDEPAWSVIARAAEAEPLTAGAPVYAAGGYYHVFDSPDRLREELRGYLDTGYSAAKIKIGGLPPAQDRSRVEAALEVLGAGSRLAVDANGRFGAEQAIAHGEALDDLDLLWYEEPGDPLDFELNRALAERYSGPIATGENLFSTQDVRNLLRYGGIRADRDVLQMDAGLSYGLTEYLEMIGLMEAHGVSRTQAFPHGGHLINLHIVIGLGLGGCEAYPGVFQPFGGFSSDCRIEDGRIHPSDAAGFGLERKAELAPEINELLQDLGGGTP